MYKSKIEPKLIHRGQSKATWEVSLRSKLKKRGKGPKLAGFQQIDNSEYKKQIMII